MPLELTDSQHTLDEIVAFIRQTFSRQGKTKGVIAVSGGIDSAVSLTVLSQALGSKNVIPLLLPHHDQPMDDAYVILEHNDIPKSEWRELNIFEMVRVASETLQLSDSDLVRTGNLKARCRMMAVYDVAKKEEALVSGTENKSEHFLGYFTRFGDAASDLEPMCHLYKTQVRKLATFLKLPETLITKPPSAGLWIGQTDEQEMGFTYEQADQVLFQLIEEGKTASDIQLENVPTDIIHKVAAQVEAMQFKLEVPYTVQQGYI